MIDALILIGMFGVIAAFRIWRRSRERRAIDTAIAQSAVFETTPIRFNGNKRQCRRAEAIAISHGWRKASQSRWRLLWQTARFVPANEHAAKPQQVLAALDGPREISNIELPGFTRPKEN